MNYVKNEKENAYLLKNELYNLKYLELKDKYYIDENSFKKLLINIEQLLKDDPYFLFLGDQNMEKIYKIINEYRFTKKLNREIVTKENEVLINLNIIKSRKKDYMIETYIDEQKEKRFLRGDIEDELLGYIAYDYEVIKNLKNESVNLLDRVQFLSSSFYLINKFPELYLNNEIVIRKWIFMSNLLRDDKERVISKNAKVLSKTMNSFLVK